MDNKLTRNQKVSQRKKNANDKQWFKDQADLLDRQGYDVNFSFNKSDEISEYKRMKVNYDLFNNTIDPTEFGYVCKPYGNDFEGELPADMTNRDIISGKVKALLGMQLKRGFKWKVLATNKEATTRKEQEKFGRTKEFVISNIMLPIRQQAEQQFQADQKGRELTEEEQEQINQQIEAAVQKMTPEEVKKYMERDHQDPSEILASQLLQYLEKRLNLQDVFDLKHKHGLISGYSPTYVGILNKEPVVKAVNALRFRCGKTPDLRFIENAEWATYEFRMTPSEVVSEFTNELSDKEIDDIYENFSSYDSNIVKNTFFEHSDIEEDYTNTVRVLHCVWKSLRKIGLLTYIDENGEEQMTVVHEGYKLNEDAGDVKVTWEWIPEVYECWKIGSDLYKRMQPIPGQFKDIDNIYHCKLPYYGAIYDNLNSRVTSLIDRLKSYQYYFNIIMYRIELLLASDKGKKILMNINAIPKSSGIDIKTWQYFFDNTHVGWFNPDEEGVGYSDVNALAKSIDMSLASDINNYISLAEYIRVQAGKSVGIPDQVEGQISPNEAVGNVQQNLIQTSYILEPYFALDNLVNKNILQALLDTARVAYSMRPPQKLSYILDDMSVKLLELDPEMLDNNSYGIFVENSVEIAEIQDNIRQLTHAAMQNQAIELSEALSVLRQKSSSEAEEILKVAEKARQEREDSMQQREADNQQQLLATQEKHRATEHEREKELIILKEEERRKTEVQKASLMAASFNPDQDVDKDGENDFIEIFKDGEDAQIKREKNQLDRDKFEHQKVTDKEKLKLEEKKIAIARNKPRS